MSQETSIKTLKFKSRKFQEKKTKVIARKSFIKVYKSS